MPCPTCGAVHTPGTPHQPLQTMAQRPPPPAPEEDRPPPPAADPDDSAAAGDSQLYDDEPSGEGITRARMARLPGRTGRQWHHPAPEWRVRRGHERLGCQWHRPAHEWPVRREDEWIGSGPD